MPLVLCITLKGHIMISVLQQPYAGTFPSAQKQHKPGNVSLSKKEVTSTTRSTVLKVEKLMCCSTRGKKCTPHLHVLRCK